MSDPMHAVQEFILGRNPKLGQLDSELDLIDSRAINSLAFVEFIFLLEELTGESYEDWRNHRDGDSFHTRQSQRTATAG